MCDRNHINFQYVAHNVISALPEIFNNEKHVNVTFYCQDGQTVRGHQLLLGSVSPFLKDLFLQQEFIFRDTVEIYLPDVLRSDLDNVLRYIYEGLIRLDEREQVAFLEIKQLLGLKIPCGEELVPQATPKVQKKRRASNDSVPSVPSKKGKFSKSKESNAPKEKEAVIHSLNNMLSELSSKSKEPVREGPLLVPIKYLKTFLQIIEERKAEKRLEQLVEATVKQQLKKLKLSFKNPSKHQTHGSQLDSAAPPTSGHSASMPVAKERKKRVPTVPAALPPNVAKGLLSSSAKEREGEIPLLAVNKSPHIKTYMGRVQVSLGNGKRQK